MITDNDRHQINSFHENIFKQLFNRFFLNNDYLIDDDLKDEFENICHEQNTKYIISLLLAKKDTVADVYEKYLEHIKDGLTGRFSMAFPDYFAQFQNKFFDRAQKFWQANFRKLILECSTESDDCVLTNISNLSQSAYKAEKDIFKTIMNNIDHLYTKEDGSHYEDCYKATISLTETLLHPPEDEIQWSDNNVSFRVLVFYDFIKSMKGDDVTFWVTEDEYGHSTFYFFLLNFRFYCREFEKLEGFDEKNIKKAITNIKNHLKEGMADVLSKVNLEDYFAGHDEHNGLWAHTPLMAMLKNCNPMIFKHVIDFHQVLGKQAIKIWDVPIEQTVRASLDSHCDERIRWETPLYHLVKLVENVEENYDGLLPFIEKVHELLSVKEKAFEYWTLDFVQCLPKIRCPLTHFLSSLDVMDLTPEQESLVFTLWKGSNSVLKIVMSDSFNKSTWRDDSRTRLNQLKEWVEQQINLSQFGYHYAMFNRLGVAPSSKIFKSCKDHQSAKYFPPKILYKIGLFSAGNAVKFKLNQMNNMFTADSESSRVSEMPGYVRR
ncbi:MAG TPA: hypothetical protein QF353_06225 [Gammaproteobacteria bacterium]|nr:hypothetical protein [Gammaproteobacteria bacterium]